MKFFVLISLILIVVGCSPWEKEEYIDEKGPPRTWPWDKSSKSYDHLKVNDAVVQVYFHPHNSTYYSGNSPFIMRIYVVGPLDFVGEKAIIHKVNVRSDKGKIYHLNLDKLPIELIFEGFPSDNFSIDSYKVKTSFPFRFKDREIIYVSPDIEVIANNKSVRKEVNYKFVPKLKSGLFQLPRP